MPVGKEENFKGVIDLVAHESDYLGLMSLWVLTYSEMDIPAELLDEAVEYREKMIEEISSHDDALMEKYLSGEELTEQEIMSAIRTGTIAIKICPVICGSSFKNKGVQNLLDAVVDYMPSPLDIPAIKGIDVDSGAEIERQCI